MVGVGNNLCRILFTVLFAGFGIQVHAKVKTLVPKKEDPCSLSLRFFFEEETLYLNSFEGPKVRVSRQTHNCYQKVPLDFRLLPNFVSLALDPAHKNISCASLREAMVALDSVNLGLISGPIKRGPPEADFVDALNQYWEIKAPVSPLKGAEWRFDVEKAAKSIVKELRGTKFCVERGPCQKVNILLDTSLLNYRDRAELWDYLTVTLSEEEFSRIVDFVKIPARDGF